MAKTNAVRVFRLFWVAWTENDFGAHGHIRYGLTEQQARFRAATKGDK